MKERLSTRWLLRRATILRVGLGSLVAVATISGCYGIVEGLTEAAANSMFAPRERLSFSCNSKATLEPFQDSALVEHATFDGPVLERPAVAVLVIPGWRYSWWTLRAREVDGRPFQAQCSSEAKLEASTAARTRECLRLAVLPGSRLITLSAVSEGRGSVWDDSKVKGARIEEADSSTANRFGRSAARRGVWRR